MAQLGFVEAAQSIAEGLLDAKHKAKRQAFDEEVAVLCKQFRSKLSVHCKSSPQFQLQHMGHLLPRPPPKNKDPRMTSFTPDEWQCLLLDAVDERDSCLVCAPTSSGKTFISHYCMDKVMHDPKHKDGVVIFVAPTKALINQIAAQVGSLFARLTQRLPGLPILLVHVSLLPVQCFPYCSLCRSMVPSTRPLASTRTRTGTGHSAVASSSPSRSASRVCSCPPPTPRGPR